MKTLTVTEVARNFSAVMDEVERDQEEIILVRNHKTIARLVPESAEQNALEMLGDLYRTLDDKTADALVRAIGEAWTVEGNTCNELRDPWGS